MAKLLVNLSVPSICESYDILIPDFMRIRVLTPILAGLVAELSSDRYVVSGKECLCIREHSKSLDRRSTVKECGIRNGDHLLLF